MMHSCFLDRLNNYHASGEKYRAYVLFISVASLCFHKYQGNMSFRSIFQHISAGFGVLCNFILIILIIKKSPKTLGSYKILMIYIAIFDIFYAVIDALIVPVSFNIFSKILVSHILNLRKCSAIIRELL